MFAARSVSSVTDLNWSISPSDFMNCAAFLAYFGSVDISPHLPKAASLLTSSHVLFLFPVCGYQHVLGGLQSSTARALLGVKSWRFSGQQELFEADLFLSHLYYKGAGRFTKTLCVFLTSFLWVSGRWHAVLCRFFHLNRLFPIAQGFSAPMLA